jgi:hypothetical protein
MLPLLFAILGNVVAHAGFDPATTGLWAQHANRCANVLISYISCSKEQVTHYLNMVFVSTTLKGTPANTRHHILTLNDDGTRYGSNVSIVRYYPLGAAA